MSAAEVIAVEPPSRASVVSASAAVMKLEGVSKVYDTGDVSVTALKNVSLTVSRGDFVAIVGASGSGKSTLMNILGCLDRPTSGRYLLAGHDVSTLDADTRAVMRNRFLGFIFQGFNLLARTSALENVELPLVYRGVGAKERRARAMQMLTLVGLADRAHHTSQQLSGGQQQRVAMARALVTDPEVLLADEPTGNLDSHTSDDVMALFQWLNRDKGLTVVVVTHEADVAQCARRMVTVRDGEIASDAPVDKPRALARPTLMAATQRAQTPS